MKDSNSFFEGLLHNADLLDRTAGHLPVVEIAGDKRVIVENHFGIIGYCPQEITIRVKYGSLSVEGRDLVLSIISKAAVVVSGCIDAVKLNRSTER